jgi:NAD(P)-dependent dehydrogenase (short-subunit alcohol dehydrogenase family)
MGLLDGKAVIVTGAGRGLGRAYAEALAAAGARVVVNDVDAAEARETVARIARAGGEAEASDHDVADWSAAKRLVERCVAAYGKLDVLVNNAGVANHTPIWEETEESFDRTFRVNAKGVFTMGRHAMDHMIPRRSGCIINATSGAQAGFFRRAIYGASKAAVASFTYGWAMELAEHNIRVNAISPLAQTRMSLAPPPADGQVPVEKWPERVAPLVVYLASDDAWWVTGQVFRLAHDTFSLFTHPKPVRAERKPEGWTAADIRDQVERNLRPHLQPIGLDAPEYSYDRILRPPG